MQRTDGDYQDRPLRGTSVNLLRFGAQIALPVPPNDPASPVTIDEDRDLKAQCDYKHTQKSHNRLVCAFILDVLLQECETISVFDGHLLRVR
jgi:hypothetical protein